LASGRDADIYEYGPGLVLRRARDGRPIGSEARIMSYLHDKGYPVPRIDEVSEDGTAIVMERIEGVDMVTSLSRRPWTATRCGRMLGELHSQLHELDAPQWLRDAPVGPAGHCILHLDLHPLNVMMTTTGPVVIDWANAAKGRPEVDIAVAWVLLGAAQPPAGPVMSVLVRVLRGMLLKSFLASAGAEQARGALRDAVTYKVLNPNMSDDENAAMWRLLEENGL
jgi:aminoglycoside phosphotransferase (APT) family kinase protein